ncbi:MAG: glycosyltransferase family 4 protein [Candidatus Moranbacteria bacterium]|nr:glycosyltransferase family 4 protein [Candidatus Moranbacteria bacterium]
MRIAFIGQKGIPAVSGGVEKRVEELSSRMAEMGHEVFVYARNNYTDRNLKEYRGVKIIHLPNIPTKHLDAISHTFLATMHALFQGYDVINYQAPGPSTLSWIIKIFNRKTALVGTFNSRDCFHQKWDWLARTYLRFGEYIICTIPHKTIVVSKSLYDWARKKYGTYGAIIPNGAEIAHNPETNLLSQWGLKEKRYILYVGRLIKHKGIHYLIEAFKRLEDTNKLPNNFKLVIAGDGFHTDEYVKYLRLISEKRGNIIFTGAQSGKALSQLFSHTYLFVQPSESEGLSIALLEAMGYGIAPLVSNIKENKEAVGNAGFTFIVKDIEDLKEKLAYLLNKPAETERIGALARERVRREFSWDSAAGKTLRAYQDVINSLARK